MAEFYHVERVTGKLTKGQIIELIYSKHTITDKTNRAFVYTTMFPNGITSHGWEYLLNTNHPNPNQDQNGMIEMMAEFIRRSYFPERISRFQSFFAFKTIDDAEQFASQYSIKTKESEIKPRSNVWLVQCDKSGFEGDMKFLGLGDCWLDAITKIHLYWSGEQGSNPLIEVLLKPPVKILEKVKTIL